MTPAPRRIVLGVGGGIAAYKAVELLRLLTESGHDVVVVPTESALRFVGAATWAALVAPSGDDGGLVRGRGRAPRASRPGGRAASSWRQPPPTCWPERPTASPTIS